MTDQQPSRPERPLNTVQQKLRPAGVKPTAPVDVPRQHSPQQELDVLIRARYPIVYVVSWEEERVERCLRKIAEARNKKLFVWTITQGLVRSGAEPPRGKGGGNSTTDPIAALDAVVDQVEPAIYLFKDFHPFTAGERCNLTVIRKLRDVAHHVRDTYKSIIIVSPEMHIAPELAKDITVLEFGLPRPEDFSQLLDRIVEDVKDNPQVRINLEGDSRERLLHAARGLTLKEAENVFAKTLVLEASWTRTTSASSSARSSRSSGRAACWSITKRTRSSRRSRG